jgi:hypothetical protein
VKVSEGWPKIKFFDFHKILNNLLEGQQKVPRATVHWFSVQARTRSVVSSSGSERYTNSGIFVNYFYGDNIIY